MMRSADQAAARWWVYDPKIPLPQIAGDHSRTLIFILGDSNIKAALRSECLSLPYPYMVNNNQTYWKQSSPTLRGVHNLIIKIICYQTMGLNNIFELINLDWRC